MIDEKNDLDIGIDLVTTALRDVLAFATDEGIDPDVTKKKILRTTIIEVKELMNRMPTAQLRSALEQATSERTASGETRAEAVMETIATIEACYAIVAGCERVIWGDEE
tara:strand:- start:2278 stop:2604 length:327 start_codon:yes stop_codon:yes gene_type:complete